MTQTKPSHVPIPRMLDDFQTATRLGKSVAWFRDHRAELEAKGFPRYDDLLKGRDGDAIEAWLDRRSGLAAAANDKQAWLEAV